jgi:hypothetical protein
MTDKKSAMTAEETNQLQILIDRAEMAYDAAPLIDAYEYDLTGVEDAEDSIHSFVEGLLAEREARIAELKAALEEVTGKRNWYKEAYEIVTGGTNPL